MIAYKGFHRHEDGTLWCMDMQYEVGKTYKYDGDIALCSRGFHACHELHQTWQFYPNDGNTVYYEVECGGSIIESKNDDGKFVCSEITLLREIDITGVERFDWCWNFSEGFAVVVLNGKYNYLTTGGKYLSETWFAGCRSFSEGFGVVGLNGKENYLTTEGKYFSETWFGCCDRFREGFAVITLNGKYNYITTEGKLLSEQWFDLCGIFSEGYGRAKLNGKEYKIDKVGKLIKLTLPNIYT